MAETHSKRLTIVIEIETDLEEFSAQAEADIRRSIEDMVEDLCIGTATLTKLTLERTPAES